MSDALLRFEVEPGEVGRVDKIVASRFPGSSRAEIARLFSRGGVRIDGSVAKKGSAAPAGAIIELREAPPGPEDLRPVPEPDRPLATLHADEAIFAVAKPPGVPSHPLRAGERGTAANALVAADPALAHVGRDPREAGLIHRLDTGTSGVLVAARTQPAWTSLRHALSRGHAAKTYLALVRGEVADRGRETAPLGQRGGRAIVTPRGLPAITEWDVLARAGEYALVRCAARTGRMHQIRAHLAHAGAPIAGDVAYGGPPPDDLGLIGHFLHAESIRLPHPATGADLLLCAPMPPDRIAALEQLSLPMPVISIP